MVRPSVGDCILNNCRLSLAHPSLPSTFHLIVVFEAPGVTDEFSPLGNGFLLTEVSPRAGFSSGSVESMISYCRHLFGPPPDALGGGSGAEESVRWHGPAGVPCDGLSAYCCFNRYNRGYCEQAIGKECISVLSVAGAFPPLGLRGAMERAVGRRNL